MLTFIPPYLGDEVKSNAERKVFDALHALNLKNAVIIHSLGLPRHEHKIYSELDFIIVCEYGVACLEIKGGRVSCFNGVWEFIDRNGIVNNKTEGPFEQVIGNMFSLRKRIMERFKNYPKFNRIDYVCGVMFPDIEFKYKGQSIITEIIYDTSCQYGDITNYIKGIFHYWHDKNQRKKNEKAELLSTTEINTIKEYLRGDFGFVPSLGEIANHVDQRLLRLTEEQFAVLDSLSENDRLIIEGSAGTGKTVLAVEYAKRQAASGKRVLLIVYNKNLAIMLKKYEGDLLDIFHFHGLISKYIAVTNNSHEYFEKELPELFYEKLCSNEIAKYDTIVVDEAQDLLSSNFLMCFDELLKGGLDRGNWCIFYDSNQNIYNSDIGEALDYLKNLNVTKWKLQYNCRNTRQIGLLNAYISHFPAAKILKEDGSVVEFVEYQDEREFIANIKALIRKFKINNVNLNDITILSPCTFDNSILSRSCALEGVCDVVGATETNQEGIRYATIYGFKGLDSKIVILCDVDKIAEPSFARVFYTGASRARANLYICCSKLAKKELDLRYIDGVNKFLEEEVVNKKNSQQ